MFKRLVTRPGTTALALASLGAVLTTVAGCTTGTPSGATAAAGATVAVSSAPSSGTAATPTSGQNAQSTAPGAVSGGNSGSASGSNNNANSGSGPNSNSDSGSGPNSNSNSGSGSGSNSGPGANSNSGPNSVAACLLSGLSIKTGPYLSPAGTGIAAEPVILTNTGSAACTALGWPGVAALDSVGSEVYQVARVGPEGSPITLAPGQSASAVLYAVTSLGGAKWGGSSSCAQVPNLLVTPPNETHSGQVGFGSPICVTPALTALLPGTGGTVSAPAEYYEALQLWKAGATAISADQGSYEIEAENLLINALGAGVAGTGGFQAAATELTQLSGLPDAMMNSSQQAEFNTDASALNAFFGTSGLYN